MIHLSTAVRFELLVLMQLEGESPDHLLTGAPVHVGDRKTWPNSLCLESVHESRKSKTYPVCSLVQLAATLPGWVF